MCEHGWRLFRIGRFTATAVVLCLGVAPSRAQSGGAVCDSGFGRFTTKFSTGVTVQVGAAREGGFAQHSCEASLTWHDERLMAVPSAERVDIDVLGADLGFGVPVVAFESWKSKGDWHSTCAIYSLDKHPHLLRTITGGDEYRAVDADLNRHVAIWTTDASAVAGLDGLTYADLDAPPTIVLDVQHGRVVDVSAWYRKQYDRQIAGLRRELSAQALREFRESDGRLAFGSMPPGEWVRLRKTKVTVLEIVWAYLYSGRTEQAWAELSRDWPTADVGRIRAEILSARAHGIESQTTSVVQNLPPKWQQTAFVFESLREPTGRNSEQAQLPKMFGAAYSTVVQRASVDDMSPQEAAADTAPKAILMWRPPSPSGNAAQAGTWETIILTIDEAGKVHRARMARFEADPSSLRAAMHWRFIPAYRDGKPVAYRLKLQVTPYQ